MPSDSQRYRRLLALSAALLGVAMVLALAPLVWDFQFGSDSSAASAALPSQPPSPEPAPEGPFLLPDGPESGAPPVPVPETCPAEAARPDPDRPSVSLRFDVSADRASVTGIETVTFRPDAAVDELVFRLWPNAAVSAAQGASLEVGSVAVGGREHKFDYESVGASTAAPGTVLAVPLEQPVAAGEAVTSRLEFTLTLPPAGTDRFGVARNSAWWGSGHPMLAWIDGQGWHRDPPPGFLGEGAASEAADTDIVVVASEQDTVLTSGRVREIPLPEGAAVGSRAWRAVNPVARDVSVAVGRMAVRESTVEGVVLPPGVAGAQEGGLPVSVGVAAGGYPDVASAAQALDTATEMAVDAVRALSDHLGFFPYPSLSLTVLPGIGAAGIEYPGSILLGTLAWEQVIPHEVAHQWFYGMVGNNQSIDPWLDEAFATYLEETYNKTGLNLLSVRSISDPVGWPVSQFSDAYSYFLAVYARGGGALQAARAASGRGAFDDATRCYLRAQAWQVAEPADVATAVAHLPRTTEILESVGALPQDSSQPVGGPSR